MYLNLSPEAHTAALAVYELSLPPAQREFSRDTDDALMVEVVTELVARIPEEAERVKVLDYWASLTG
ncbi:hypothetical protein AB0J52_00690 [Spirillospora sp. NPDC049652]